MLNIERRERRNWLKTQTFPPPIESRAPIQNKEAVKTGLCSIVRVDGLPGSEKPAFYFIVHAQRIHCQSLYMLIHEVILFLPFSFDEYSALSA